MSSAEVHDIKKEVKTYMIVFGALLFLTIVTVAVSYLHLNTFWAVTVALIIASIKVSLVGGYFMHLVSERVLIYGALILVASIVVGLLFLPAIEHRDHIIGTVQLHDLAAQVPPHNQGH